jgi:hypothetical protein
VETLSAQGVTVQLHRAGVASARVPCQDGEVAGFLVGDLHGRDCLGSLSGVVAAYMEEGPGFVRRLHGSFALMIWDGRSGEVVVLTDPLGTRAVFHTTFKGDTWLASTHAFHELPYRGMDRVAVAQYLVNGIPMNRRTLLAGVRVLEGGSIHRITPRGLRSARHWEYRFREVRTPRSDLMDRLHHTLIAAVERRIGVGEAPVISLSGGFDAPAIACALREPSVGDVTCFTYAHPQEPSNGDADVARRLAHSLGFTHHTIPSCRGGLDSVLADNIHVGRGLTRLTVESDAWRSVATLLATKDAPILFVGEEFYGGPDAEVSSREELLALVGIVGLHGIGPLSPAVSRRAAAEWEEMIRADLGEVLERLPVGVPLHDLKDLLYLEERARRRLAWRETFAGECAAPRLPLLDREILELMEGVSTADRRGKRLFREMLLRRYPEAFQSPRAASGSQVSVRRWAERVVRRESDRIRELLTDADSPFDDVITPEELRSLSDRVQRGVDPARRAYRVRRRAARLLRSVMVPRTWIPTPIAPVPESLLLVRALFLREFFKARESGAESVENLTGSATGARGIQATALD